MSDTKSKLAANILACFEKLVQIQHMETLIYDDISNETLELVQLWEEKIGTKPDNVEQVVTDFNKLKQPIDTRYAECVQFFIEEATDSLKNLQVNTARLMELIDAYPKLPKALYVDFFKQEAEFNAEKEIYMFKVFELNTLSNKCVAQMQIYLAINTINTSATLPPISRAIASRFN